MNEGFCFRALGHLRSTNTLTITNLWAHSQTIGNNQPAFGSRPLELKMKINYVFSVFRFLAKPIRNYLTDLKPLKASTIRLSAAGNRRGRVFRYRCSESINPKKHINLCSWTVSLCTVNDYAISPSRSPLVWNPVMQEAKGNEKASRGPADCTPPWDGASTGV